MSNPSKLPPRTKAQPADDPSALGVRLRHARKVAGLTLKQVAVAAGCSESLISKLENGVASPSLAMLHRLARAMGSNVPELTAEDWVSEEPILRTGRRQITRFATDQAAGYIDLERISHAQKGSLLQADVHIVAPGMVSDLIEHAGEELGYILAGHIELTIDATTYTLGPGDSFHFSSSTPHGYRNAGPDEARILWVNTPATF